MTIIISASIEHWIRPWAEKNNFCNIISTIPEFANGIVTGRFTTQNCSGPEKVKRLLKEYPNRSAYCLYAYGNSKGDYDMMALADEKVMV